MGHQEAPRSNSTRIMRVLLPSDNYDSCLKEGGASRSRDCKRGMDTTYPDMFPILGCLPGIPKQTGARHPLPGILPGWVPYNSSQVCTCQRASTTRPVPAGSGGGGIGVSRAPPPPAGAVELERKDVPAPTPPEAWSATAGFSAPPAWKKCGLVWDNAVPPDGRAQGQAQGRPGGAI